MNKITSKLAVLVCAVSLAVAMSISAVIIPKAAPQKADAPITAVVPQKEQFGYILRDFGGKIAVFKSSDIINPQYVTDYDTAALPKADRELLVTGIHAQTKEEISMLLEDFGS